MSQNTSQAKPVVPFGEFVVGTVVPYGSKINAASLEGQGWLYCDGSELSRTSYADLFAVIGTLHGAGDGVKTFNLPDYRGYFQRGVDDGTGRDPDAQQREPAAPGGHPGDECGSQQGYATAWPTNKDFSLSSSGKHTHTIQHIPRDNSSYPIAGSFQAIWNGGVGYSSDSGEHTHIISAGDAETRPLNAYVNYLIKYRAS